MVSRPLCVDTHLLSYLPRLHGDGGLSPSTKVFVTYSHVVPVPRASRQGAPALARCPGRAAYLMPRTIARNASRFARTVARGPWSWNQRLPFGVSTMAESSVWSGLAGPAPPIPTDRA